MSEKFPYGYDLNAYIDKAFEHMKADFPWATRDMIPEQTYYGIEKVGDDYHYVIGKSFLTSISIWIPPALIMWARPILNATLASKSS